MSGIAWTERQLTRLLGVVTLLEERLHWARGPCCERPLMSRVAPKDLAALDADAIEAQRLLRDRVSPIKIALLIGAFLCRIVAVAWPAFLLLAWLPGGPSRTWFRVACRICLLLHLAAMNAPVLLTAVGRKEVGRLSRAVRTARESRPTPLVPVALTMDDRR